MMFTDRQIKDLVALVRRRYPDWDGFDHPPFVDDEIAYKQKAAELAAGLLNQAALDQLVAETNYDALIDRLEKVAQKTNLLYLSTPSSGDLAALYHPHLDRPAYCHQIADLLYGPGDSPARLQRYVDFAGRQSLPNRWPLPTYFLFLCRPQTDLLVKPETMRWFLQFAGQGHLLQSLPTAEAYAAVLDQARALRHGLAAYNPTDMIAVQSFIWLCARESKARVSRLTPEAQIALDVPRTTYDIRAAAHVLHDRESEDIMSETNVPTYDTFMTPMIQALKMLGGGGTIAEINQKTIEIAGVTSEQQQILHNPEKGGLTEVAYRLAWTRTYLKKYGLMDNPRRGYWQLTAAGEEVEQVDETEVKRAVVKEYESSISAAGATPVAELDQNLYFTIATFDWLAQLAVDPTNDFYQANKTFFKKHLERPIKQFFLDVAVQLPEEITAVLETRKRLFSHIPKNDYGQGGAWSHYWGAFYPLGSKRTADVQLFIWINEDVLAFGFYIGHYGEKLRQRFEQNCRQNHTQLLSLLATCVVEDDIFYGDHESLTIIDGVISDPHGRNLEKFLQNPQEADFRVAYILPRDTVVACGKADLLERAADAYVKLFPFVLLTMTTSPLPGIHDYLQQVDLLDIVEVETLAERNPSYPLAALAADAGVAEAELDRWVRAVERKGQAIFYGPPGTGKTYLAEGLARHLVGGGDGFAELVQFHPAYAYEDFMQGLRPESGADGRLSYRLTPGRFLDFCRRAARCDDRCVLIIDEINRANLAQVFGELMYLLEYRDRDIPLAGGGQLRIPANVRLLGTMNTADRSIALVDHALRRRFAFIHLAPDYDLLRRYHEQRQTGFDPDGLITVLRRLNAQIGDPHYELGITFFLDTALGDRLEDIWRLEVEPYLEEYFFDQPDRVDEFRWAHIAVELL